LIAEIKVIIFSNLPGRPQEEHSHHNKPQPRKCTVLQAGLEHLHEYNRPLACTHGIEKVCRIFEVSNSNPEFSTLMLEIDHESDGQTYADKSMLSNLCICLTLKRPPSQRQNHFPVPKSSGSAAKFRLGEIQP
jgi:hypothetical protein